MCIRDRAEKPEGRPQQCRAVAALRRPHALDRVELAALGHLAVGEVALRLRGGCVALGVPRGGPRAGKRRA
eukprot:1041038-Alexandrium_andersonii.AAC.1